MSSSYVKSGWEGVVLGIDLTSLEAVMEATEEAVEQMAPGSGVAITGGAPPVVVGTGSRRGA